MQKRLGDMIVAIGAIARQYFAVISRPMGQ